MITLETVEDMRSAGFIPLRRSGKAAQIKMIDFLKRGVIPDTLPLHGREVPVFMPVALGIEDEEPITVKDISPYPFYGSDYLFEVVGRGSVESQVVWVNHARSLIGGVGAYMTVFDKNDILDLVRGGVK